MKIKTYTLFRFKDKQLKDSVTIDFEDIFGDTVTESLWPDELTILIKELVDIKRELERA